MYNSAFHPDPGYCLVPKYPEGNPLPLPAYLNVVDNLQKEKAYLPK
jgi:hypothetical protein